MDVGVGGGKDEGDDEDLACISVVCTECRIAPTPPQTIAIYPFDPS